LKQYLNITQIKNKIYHKYIDENAQRQVEFTDIKPELFVKTNSDYETDYKSFNGGYLDKVDFNSIKHAQSFVYEYKDHIGFDIYGNRNYWAQFIHEYYPDIINYNKSLLNVVSLDIENLIGDGRTSPTESAMLAKNEITVITLGYNGKYFTFTTKPFENNDKNVIHTQAKSEQELLYNFLMKWREIDPDIITGWFIDQYDIPYIVNRIRNLLGDKYVKWLSPSGKQFVGDDSVKYNDYIHDNKHYDILGITTLDYLAMYKKFTFTKREKYSLDFISHIELGKNKLDYSEYSNLDDMYNNNPQKYFDYNIIDVKLIDELDEKLNLIELCLNLSYKSKINFDKVFSQVQMWDSYIYHELMKDNIIIPPKQDHNKSEKYEGAAVIEPKIGLHNWVVSYDLDGLYPHLMMQYNISPETIRKILDGVTVDKLLNKSINVNELLEGDDDLTLCANGVTFSKTGGIIPKLMRDIYKERKEVKQQMLKYEQMLTNDKNNKELQNLYSKCKVTQMGLKVFLNSCYGMLGNQYSRYYNINIAEAITLSGQLSLMWIKNDMNTQLNKEFKNVDADYIIAGDSVGYESEVHIRKLLNNGNYDYKSIKINELFNMVDIDNKYLNDDKGKQRIFNMQGWETLTYDETIHENCYKPIKYIYRHKVDKPIWKVNINNCEHIIVTDDHSLMGYVNTKNRLNHKSSIFKRVKVKELNKTSLIQNKHLKIPLLEYDNIDSDEVLKYQFLGYMLADGNYNHKMCELSVGIQDVNEIEIKLFKPLLKANLITRYTIRENRHDVRIYGVNMFNFCGDICNRTGKLETLTNIENLEEYKIKAFLSGYFTGDGHAGVTNIKVSSIHKNIILKIKRLLLLINISSTIFKDNTENSYNGVFSGTFNYVLVIKSDFNEVAFILNRKNDYKDYNDTPRRRYFKKNGYNFTLSTIKNITPVNNYNEFVYDIEVEDTHTFYANDLLVHNTDSIYTTFNPIVKNYDDNLSNHEITIKLDKFSKSKIQPMINQSYINLAEYMHAKEQKMNMSREVIASRGIWRKKKNYALDVYNSEGVIYNPPKLKIMGLESVKSSTPQLCRIAITKIIEIMLREDELTLQEFVSKFKIEFNNAPLEDIAKPTGVNDIVKWDYDDKFNKWGFTTRTPAHVKASITYNRLIDELDLYTKYKTINNGDKIKYLYLLKSNPLFTNTIGFPDVLPSEFKLNEYIDYNNQFYVTFKKPLDSLCNIINWKSEKLKTFF